MCQILTDSHLHIADEGFPGTYGDYQSLQRAVSCTASVSDWDAQSGKSADNTVQCYGVHPWFCGEWNGDVAERLRSILASDGRFHVGEIGLDAKKGDISEQMPAFIAQLEIAKETGRVATIHITDSEKEVLDAVRRAGCKAVLHSFSAESYAKPFAEAGCFFSISPRILSRSDARIIRLLGSIPDDRLLLESDAPHQGRNFTSMGEFASRIAGFKGVPPEELLRTVADNFTKVFG